jgi:hypothetical protein
MAHGPWWCNPKNRPTNTLNFKVKEKVVKAMQTKTGQGAGGFGMIIY